MSDDEGQTRGLTPGLTPAIQGWGSKMASALNSLREG